jgi:aryl-alcohol dehydrogenase-like predicted oxidoreductase
MGLAIKRGIDEGVWTREALVVSTKVYFGVKGFIGAGPNGQGLSRKHLVKGVQASLQRLGLEYVDVIFCHRQEPFTPIEETVRAMNFVRTRPSTGAPASGWPRTSRTRKRARSRIVLG